VISNKCSRQRELWRFLRFCKVKSNHACRLIWSFPSYQGSGTSHCYAPVAPRVQQERKPCDVTRCFAAGSAGVYSLLYAFQNGKMQAASGAERLRERIYQ